MFRLSVRYARFVYAVILAVLLFGLFVQPQQVQAFVALEVTPLTWNVVGLDSNRVDVGPNRFPVGARVCNRGDETAFDVTSAFAWQTADPYINLRPGSRTAYNSLGLNLAPGGCTDFYYEVEITRNSNAYDHKRRYTITAAARTAANEVINGSTPSPREVYVEHLVSQARNAVTDVRVDGASIAAGGTMSLMVGRTYTIQLVGQTATGYNQLESFINFPNTIFEILSVNSTYTTVDPPAPNAVDRLYSDACAWEPDPTSLNYRSCTGVGKTGGVVRVTYVVRILQVGSINPEPLNTLFYDFSGSSYHYNSDYSTNVRYAAIIDPSGIKMDKSFSPDPTNAGGISNLTFTITNPTPATINGVSFTDTFPTTPGQMQVAASPNASTSNCGSPTFAPVPGASSISFSGGTLAPNGTCTVRLSVTIPVAGTYSNTSGTLRFLDGTTTIDTGDTASDTLTANNAPPPPTPVCGMLLAQWVFPNTIVPANPAASTANVTASAAIGGGLAPIFSSQNNTVVPAGTGSWGSNGKFSNLAIDAANDDYFQFALDTTNYSNVSLSFDAYRNNNGPAGMVVSSNTSAARPGTTAATLTGPSGLPSQSTWFSYSGSGTGTDSDPARNSIAFSDLNPSGLTYFYIYGANAGNANNGSDLYLDNVTFTGCAIPKAATISKVFNPVSVPVNGTSTLTFTLTNPNAAALTGASFNDPLPAGLRVANPTGASTTCAGATFAPAAGATTLNFSGGTIPASGSCTVTVNIQATTGGPHTNVSGFLSTTEAGTNTGSGGSATANLTALLPPSIVKTFAPNPILAGANTTLAFTITNPNANDSLNGIAFSDTYPGTLLNLATPAYTNNCGGVINTTANSISLSGGSLAGGAACAITVTVRAPSAGNFTNTSSAVSSTNAGAGNVASDTLLVNALNPAVAFLKQVSTSPSGPWSNYVSVAPGTSVYYRFTVENIGDVPLSNITLTDPDVTFTCNWPNPLPVGTLVVDPTAACISNAVSALPGDHINTATVDSDQTTPLSDSAMYTGAQPALSLLKEVSEDAAGPWAANLTGVAPGSSIYYRFTVTNTGNVELNTITVDDPQISAAGCVFTNPLPSGGTTDCVVGPVTAETIIGTYPNTATAHGVYRYDGRTYDSEPSTAQYQLDAPNLAVSKTNSTLDTGTPGIPFTWTLTVSNEGTAPAIFTNGWKIVTDTLPVDAAYSAPAAGNFNSITNSANIACATNTGVITCSASGADVTIDPGGSFTVSFTATPSTVGTLSNTAEVDPDSRLTETDESDNSGTNVVTVAGTPSISLEKTGTLDMTVVDPPAVANAGDVVRYSFTVMNNGDVPLTNIRITDPLLTVSGGPLVSLAAGASDSTTFTGAYTLTQADIDAGTFLNTATVSATPPAGPDVTANDGDTQVLIANPSLNVQKLETSTGPYSVDDTITYSIKVTNTGNVTLNGVTVSDASAVLGICTPAQPASLAPGATMSCPAAHLVSQADVDAGSYANTATAGATEVSPVTSTVTVTIPQNPALSVLKSETSTGPYAVGDTITYDITVTNTGNITLSNVEVTDSTAVLGTCSPIQPTDLAPGATMSCPATHVVTQADIDSGEYANTATADSNETTAQTSNVTITFPASPSLTVMKSEASSGPYAVGDTITYDITVTNTGDVTLHNTVVTDPSATLGVCTPAQPASIAPGATLVCPASHLVTQADVNAGSYTNTATADSDETTPLASTVTVPFPAAPALDILKSETSTGPYAVGDAITYAIVATNTGNVTIHNVTVTDDSAVLGVCSPAQPASLAPGAAITCPAAHVVAQTDVDAGAYANTATAASDETTPVTSTVTVPFAPNPSLNVLKLETSTGPYAVGDTITYDITVTNTGNITLNNVTVTDNSAVLGTCTPAQPASLAPGLTMSCPASHMITQTDVDAGSYANTATAVSDETTPQTSTVTITFPPDPALTILKSETSTGPYAVGDTLTYSIVATNNGNITLHNVMVADNAAVLGTCSPIQPATLAPGAVITCPASHVVTQADVDAGTFVNQATADSDQTTPVTSDVTVVFPPDPALTVLKSETSSGPYAVDDTISYSILVTNTGNITLHGVAVTDNAALLGTCTPAQPADIAPSLTMTCSATHQVTQADIDNGSFVNTASAYSDETSPLTSSVTVLFPSDPGLTLVKSGNLDMALVNPMGEANVGDAINYTLTATNTGNITLSGVMIVDPLLPILSCTPTQPAVLTPGDTLACTGDYTLIQEDFDAGQVDNSATVQSDQTEPVSASNTEMIPQSDLLAIDKVLTSNSDEDNSGTVSLGDTLTFTITVTNSGNTTQTNITISDPLLTPSSVTCPSVAPADTCVLTGAYMVTQADLDAGTFTNTASAVSTQVTTSVTDTVITDIPQLPALSVLKSETSTGSYAVGDTITYDITVTNTGNITLNDVVVADSAAVLGTCSPIQPADLAPGAQMVCPASHVVTQADVDFGSYANTATADSDETSEQTSTVTVTFPAAPALDILKSETSTGPYAVGDTITYSIVATNTGNVTIYNVNVTDDSAVLGVCSPAQPANLAPGAAITCPAAHVVTQEDVDAGAYANTATAASDETTPVSSTVTVPFEHDPALTILKNETSTGPYAVGSTISYSIVVTNTGNITLNNVNVTDNAAVLGICTPTQPASLAPGATMSCPATHVVTQADVDAGSYANTATAGADEVSPVTSTVTVTIPQNPALSVLKSETSTGPYAVGDTITYDITVTNTGDVTLHNAVVTDTSAALGICTPAQPASLAPGEMMVCPATHVVTQADVDAGSYANTATADSDETTSQTSTVTVTFSPAPALSVVKSETSSGPYAVGDIITYSIVASNTGNVTLRNVRVTDNAAVLGVCTPAQPADLAPGAQMTCPATHMVTQADFDTGSFVNRTTADSDETNPVASTVTVIFAPDPALTILKSETSTGPYVVDDTITYSILVTNTGNVTLNSVAVTDNAAVLGTCTPTQPASLAPGATMSCPATHVVTQADLDAGSYVNTATADSDETSPLTSTVTVDFPVSADINLNKTGTLDTTVIDPDDQVNPGDVITFAFTVTNTGNVTLTNINLADSVAGVSISGGPIASLAPGESDSTTYTGTYALTQADITAGLFTNTATISGTPPSGSPVTDTDTDTRELIGNPAFGLAKRVVGTPAEVSPGVWEVRYEILVKNYGNLPILSLQVTDDLAAAFPLPTTFQVHSRTSTKFTVNAAYNGQTDTNLLAGTNRLEVGESGTITLVVRVTPTTVGPFNNSAAATGSTPAGDQVADNSQNLVDPDPDGDGDPSNNNDPTPVDFGQRIFDPPFGLKTVDGNGMPILRWTMVWINDSNVRGVAATVSDPIPTGSTYRAVGSPSGYSVPASAPAASTNLGVSCQADTTSTATVTTLCYYEGPTGRYPRGRIVWQGVLGPDLGATNAVNANNEIVITFSLNVNTGVTSVSNTATIDSDLNGDGDTSDTGEVQVASASEDWTLTVETEDVEELPETGFAPGLATTLPQQPASRTYIAADSLSIEIPALGVKTSIVGVPYVENGWDVTWLGNSAGWLGGTAYPTWEGNSVITGHVYNQTGLPGPFINLSKLKWGDRIIIHAFGQKYIYEVRSSRHVESDDTSVLGHKEQAWITLLTCKEYSEKTNSYLWRVAVQALLVKVE